MIGSKLLLTTNRNMYTRYTEPGYYLDWWLSASHLGQLSFPFHPSVVDETSTSLVLVGWYSFTYHRGMESWVDLGDWHMPRRFYLPAYWLGLRRSAFTCVGWQVTLCDPVAVRRESCEPSIRTLTFNRAHLHDWLQTGYRRSPYA